MFLLLGRSCQSHAIRVTFINPAAEGNNFWQQVNTIAHAAAADLDIQFEIIQSGGHRLLQKNNRSINYAKIKTRFHHFLPYDGTAFETFTKIEQAKIAFITIERTIFPDLQNQLNYPQEKGR